MFYTYQETRIWDDETTPDSSRTPVRIKSKTEIKARKRLPQSALGRKWVLIKTEESGSDG